MTWTVLLVFLLLTPECVGAKEATPQDQIETLAAALSKGDAAGALSLFDPATPSLAGISRNIQALSALPNTTCSVVIDKTTREGDSIRFETEWSLETNSVQNGPLLQRSERVTISLRQTNNSWLITGFSPLSIITPPDDTIFKRIAGLAADLNEKNQFGAIGIFSSSMKRYGEIDNDIDALITQNDLLCAIDIVSDRQTGEVHTLDLDWFMQLKARTDGGPLRERRERVKVTLNKVKNKWQIVEIEPLTILSPELKQ